MWRCRLVSVRGCWQTVPTDASCASLELSQGWGIDDVGRGSSCFWTLWRVLGASPKYMPGPISLQDINLKILNNWTNPVSIWGKIYPSFWLGMWQTFSHMQSTSGDSLRGLGVIRQVGEHFMIIGKLKPVHQSFVLFSFSIQGPKL